MTQCVNTECKGHDNGTCKTNNTACSRRIMSEAWQQRVIIEKKELDEKLEKLDAFVDSNHLMPCKDGSLLLKQRAAMHMYSGILSERIDLFE